MSGPHTTNTPVRRLISILVMLLVLAVFLSLYFFKYVPQQKSDYNRRAFMELQSVTDAFSRRDAAYQQVFSWSHGSHGQLPDSTQIKNENGKWKIVYKTSAPKNVQRMDLDSLMHLLTDGDRDIFDSYLTILQNDSARSRRPDQHNTPPPNGEIVFNAGDLSMDYEVDMDTLMKKSDGFSTTNVHDVKIEGNDYKLFLYPFPFHSQRTIMVGLISVSNYTSRYESVPIDLITTASILLLLLFVAIPLLKIYIIGSHERITTFDLRMIIGTYFIGGLVLFFLFSWNFLGSVQTANNKTTLGDLAKQIDTNFCKEIDTACLQLKKYDSLYRQVSRIHDSLGKERYDSTSMSQFSAMYPDLYRQFDDVFWINNNGKWVARWGFKHYKALPIITVYDRQYFQNMKAGDVLLLKEAKDTFPFCIEPTFSKLDDKFVSNILIRSKADPSKPGRPIMLGLSGTMYSVCNTVLPPGYGFDIIDRTGKILFNSKMDRSLLSSIYNEFQDPSTIEQYVRYRQERYYPSTNLHGETVALLVTPLKELPFTVITYYALGEDQQFQLHLLSLTSFFIGCVILLLILSAYFNEWSLTKPSLLTMSRINFSWLRPVPGKTGYYGHLLWSMTSLAAWYVLAWFYVELIQKKHEFCLLAISILLPFYLAILYFLLREKQKCIDTSIWKRRLPTAALTIPLLAIGTVLIYLLCSELHYQTKELILLIQIVFVVLIGWSVYRFSPKTKTGDPKRLLSRYVPAVVTGVLLSVIVPAMGIFCFFFKEESRTRNKQEKLAMAHSICERKDNINKEKTNYSFDPKDPSDSVFLHDLKLTKGVYFPDLTSTGNADASADSIPAHPPEMYYHLRNFLFRDDTTALTFGRSPEKASDSSWLFVKESDSEVFHHFAVWNRDNNHVRLALARETRYTALELLSRNAKKLSRVNIFLFILTVLVLLGLFCRLTASLASRIFLLGIFRECLKESCQNDILAEANPASNESSGLLKKLKDAGFTEWTSSGIRQFEEGDPDCRILYMQMELKETYKKIWDQLSSREKFVAYDFAIDSLANYKSGSPLYSLIRKGVLCVGDDDQLHFITHSLHNFVLDRSNDKTIVEQLKKAHEQGSWQSFRIPLFLLLSAAGIFVFLTQDAIYQKMTGLLTSIGSLVPLISQFFNKSDK
jgi:hypothetical protein